MINFITVCTDQYPMHYAEKITNQFKSLTNLEIDYFCITDRPKEVTGWATPIIPPEVSQGWWNKVNLFSPSMPKGWLLYMDIDIVITANFDEEIMGVIKKGKSINCISDAIGWMGVKFSSSFMIMKSGCCTKIFEKFRENPAGLVNRPGGDQVWVGPQLQNVFYIDELYPNLKKNLKFQLAQREGNNLVLPAYLPKEVKLIDCGGQPKPHELRALPYIEANWHNVPPLL